ncbi:MAG: hypothetical protein VX473_03160 [Candidatus Thermoplasmatota archaeon]|nr:hypothetical protein [Candidatus Thermoplasmatota archaeon]
MVDAPKGARLLSDTDIGDTWVDTTQIWTRVGVLTFLGAILLIIMHLIGLISPIQIVGLLIAIILTLMSFNLNRIVKMKKQLDVISIASGHPWHDSEGIGDTTVYVLNDGSEWVDLQPDVRLIPTRDPILDRTQLRDGDSEGEVLVRWEGEADPKVLAIINMAQALANAQDREEGSVDAFEAAREREETAEGILEREWMDTEEGAVDYEPGAILRAFKRSKNIEKTTDVSEMGHDESE